MSRRSRPSDHDEPADSALDSAVERVVRAVAHAPACAPPVEVISGTRWGDKGRYLVERRLGTGGMGTVYLATDSLLGRQVALKVLDGEHSESGEPRERLLREARLAAVLEHDCVARVYDVGEHDDRMFVAMEYVRGVNLRTWMSDPHTPDEVFQVIVHIAEGLQVLHDAGIVHRDLKPENVMMPERGGVKLVDFGLAGELVPVAEPTAPPGAIASGSSVSAIRGTPGYMAPEQYDGTRADTRADVFALGVIIYEIVVGARPFGGANITALQQSIRDGRTSFDVAGWQRFPAALRAATRRMLDRDREARFADGRAVYEALRGAGQHRASRVRWMFAGIGLVALSVVGVTARQRGMFQGALRHREAVAPVGMALIDEGEITVGQNAQTVARQCAELGPRCPEAKLLSFQVPSVEVDVPPFYLDVREVTNRDMVKVLNGASGSLHVEPDEDDHTPRYVRFDVNASTSNALLLDLDPKLGGIEATPEHTYRARPGRELWPVNQVTWYGAQFYCSAQGKRLPTENEWEAAARGHDDRPFPWGAAAPRCHDVAIPNDGYLEVLGCPPTGEPVPVMTSAQDVTPQGVHDLGGNVAEWVDTIYSEAGRDRVGAPRIDAPHVIRGGSFFFSYSARTSVRNRRPASIASFNVGFRCASDIR